MRKFLGRHKLLLGMELLVAILCGALGLLPEKAVFSADADEIAARLEVDGLSGWYRSGEMVLLPGVYRLRARGGDHEGTWYFTVASGETSWQALRCEETAVSAHGRDVDMEVYVADKIDTAFVSYKYIGETGQPVENIRLYRTGAGWRMLAFLLLALAALVNLLVWLRESGMKGERETALVLGLGLCVLIAYLPYAGDYFAYGAETKFHLLRIEGLKETLLRGRQFPVRIQEHWFHGHGYGVSGFCGDLFLFFPALLRILGFSLMDAYKIFVLAVLMGTAGTAYYAFYRCTENRWGALLGSALYELAPYHISMVYDRGAAGEYLGMMFLPLAFCGMYRIYTEDSDGPDYARAKIPLIVGLSGILQSSIPTCAALLAVLLLTAGALWKKTLQKQIRRELLKAALYFLLLNAWFWAAPLRMLPEDFDGLWKMLLPGGGYLKTGLAGIVQFFPCGGGENAGIPARVGAAFWVVLTAFLLMKLWRGGRRDGRCRGNPCDRAMGWSAELGLLAALFFPAMAVLLFAFMSSLFVSWLREERKSWQAAGDGIAACLLMASAAAALWSALYQADHITYDMTCVRLYTADSLDSADVGDEAYLPAAMAGPGAGYHDPAADEGLLWREYEREGLSVRLYIENPTEKELCVELPLTGYPGYELEADAGGDGPFIVRERGSHGDLRVAVPPGYEGRISVYYKGLAVCRAAEGISLAFILLCAGLAVRRRYGGERAGSRRQKEGQDGMQGGHL